MIKIVVYKDLSGNYKKISAVGHSNLDTQSKYSLLCAGVSALLQTLHYNFRIMSNVSRETVDKGVLDFEVENVDEKTDLIFLTILLGLENLAKSNKELEIIYTNL